jgi:hypothetical protein
MFIRNEASYIISFASKIVTAQLQGESLRAFGIIRIRGFRKLLHQIAIAIAVRHFVLAQRPRDLSLIETKEQKIQRDSIKLHRNCSNTHPCEKFYMKRRVHVLF